MRPKRARRPPSPKHVRRRLAVAGLAIGVPGLGAGLLYGPFLAVQQVTVKGVPTSLAPGVKAAAGIKDGQAMVSVPTTAATWRVDRIPWASSASIRRNWPHAVVIVVHQRQAIAVVPQGGAFEELDATGRAIAVVQTRPRSLPLITSVSPVPLGSTVGSGGVAICGYVNEFPLWLRSRVHSAMMSGGRLYLSLRSGPVVAMGAPTSLGQKVQNLITMMQKTALPGNSRLNLSVPFEPVLTRG